MNVNSSKSSSTITRAATPQPKKKSTAKEDAVPIDGYNGPADRKSAPDLEWQGKMRPWVSRLHSLMVRKSPVEGLENLPKSGPQVYAPTHQSGIDPGLFFELGVEDVRFMGAQEQFVGIQGPIFTKMGAFPVDRDNPGTKALKHAKEILKEKKVGLLAFPEGGILGDGTDGKVHPLKEGAAYLGIIGKAESIVPIPIHIGEDKETRIGETAVGALMAAGIGAGTVAAMAGGGLLGTIAGVVSGAMFGAATATTAFGDKTWNPYTDVMTETKYGVAGAVIGGIVGGLTSQIQSPWTGLAHGGAATLATLKAADSFIHRPVAKMKIMKPIDIKAAVAEHGRKGARKALTEELYQNLSQGKHELVFPEAKAE